MPRTSLNVKIHDVKSSEVAGGSVEDEVDRLLADWRRERPELDVAPLAVMSRLSRLDRRLDLERKAVFDEFGLEGWGFDVLAALRRAGPPYELPPRILLRHTLVSSGAMTNRIDRLEALALVTRLPDPYDRRGVLVRLTAAGSRKVDACIAALAARERELLAPLDSAARDTLADLLRRLLLPLDPPPASGVPESPSPRQPAEPCRPSGST